LRAHLHRDTAGSPSIRPARWRSCSFGNGTRRPGLTAAVVIGALLGLCPRGALAQEPAEATGMIHAFIGSATIIDANTRVSSPVARPALTIYLSSFRPRRFGPELSLQTIANAISVELSLNASLGLSYQFSRHLAVGAGGSILIGLHRWTIDDLDPHYGGYVSLTWYPLPMGSWVALGGQLRESILYDPVSNRAVYYPCIGVGLIFVPENALRLRRRTR